MMTEIVTTADEPYVSVVPRGDVCVVCWEASTDRISLMVDENVRVSWQRLEDGNWERTIRGRLGGKTPLITYDDIARLSWGTTQPFIP
jgi:hypothetical protein